MTFFRITQDHPYLNRIQSWYEGSFPIDERRSFDELKSLLKCPDMYLCALLITDKLVGFLIYWHWNDVVYMEHFAIDPNQRGKQFGQQALGLILRIPTQYVLLEVERATDEISRRRIQFYERQGFILNPFDYVQPPYQPQKSAVPMRLMSIPALENIAVFERFSDMIRIQVYERFYDTL
ncbi:GNAT family N-acetyltransferase [Spirosoma sp. KNUC1025]|uniref:GNAT family N-acetyltransferase n=1 Tax=Spirosoma sp. KNUC1025 TaxID=2894082 RepID=UPI00386B3948|nr:GNAT family N-acetyltransferase [Spirosoma sp. KNUC1025]